MVARLLPVGGLRLPVCGGESRSPPIAPVQTWRVYAADPASRSPGGGSPFHLEWGMAGGDCQLLIFEAGVKEELSGQPLIRSRSDTRFLPWPFSCFRILDGHLTT